MKKHITKLLFLLLFFFSAIPSAFAKLGAEDWDYDYIVSTPLCFLGIRAWCNGPTHFYLGSLSFSLPMGFYPSITLVFGVPTLMICSLFAWKFWFRRGAAREAQEKSD